MEMEIEKLSFEDAMARLEEIVRELENEKISLEESIEKFEMGVKLSSHCLSKLNAAEKKIEELTRSENGRLIIKDLKFEE